MCRYASTREPVAVTRGELVNGGPVTHPENLIPITTSLCGDVTCDRAVDMDDIGPLWCC